MASATSGRAEELRDVGGRRGSTTRFASGKEALGLASGLGCASSPADLVFGTRYEAWRYIDDFTQSKLLTGPAAVPARRIPAQNC